MPIEDDGQKVEPKPFEEANGVPTPITDPNAKPNESRTENLEADIKRGEWWLIRIGIATLLINTVIALIYYGQLIEMRKSTDQAVIAANAAKKSADVADATLKHIQITDEANSKASLDSFKEEQRAYISTSYAAISATPIFLDPKGGKHFCIDIHWSNGGKTPSVGSWVTRRVTYEPNAERTVKSLKIPPFPDSIGDMSGPGVDKWASGCTDPLTDNVIESIQQAKIDVLIYGVIQYRDIFGDRHETGFCYVRRSGFTPFMGCEYGNWFDKRPVR